MRLWHQFHRIKDNFNTIKTQNLGAEYAHFLFEHYFGGPTFPQNMVNNGGYMDNSTAKGGMKSMDIRGVIDTLK